MRKAAIDIGSNTLLLLIAEVDGATIKPLLELQRIPRLGKGVDSKGNLNPVSIQKALAGLLEYKNEIVRFGEIPVTVTATSAVRDAANRAGFLAEVKELTGYEVRLLSGDEEARKTYSGALSMLPVFDGINAVIDIGGGSTELALGTGDTLSGYHSFNMGCVRFTERYLKNHPPTEENLRNCREAVQETLGTFPMNWPSQNRLIGVAGTVTTLAYLLLNLTDYAAQKINGFEIGLTQVQNWIEKISSMTIPEMEHRWPQVMQGRADIILSGLLILEGVMQKYGQEKLMVSTGGLRHGVVSKC